MTFGHRLRTMRLNNTIPVVLVASAMMIALGFNTLDAMMWQFYNTSQWKVWFPNQWHLNTYLRIEVWNSYFFLGILPLILGSLVIGYISGRYKRKE